MASLNADSVSARLCDDQPGSGLASPHPVTPSAVNETNNPLR